MTETAYTEESGYKLSALTEKIIGVFYEVYNELGHGFLESVYRDAMAIALQEAGIQVVREAPVPVYFRGHQLANFRADLLVEDSVIVELKCCRALESSHEAQLLHYLCATPIEVGLLLNFGPRAVVRRLVFSNDRKNLRKSASTSG